MTPELFAIGRQIQGFLKKHHAVLYLSFVGLFLAASIYYMYQVIQTTFTPPAVTSSTISDFNQKTIDKIKSLQDSGSGAASVQLPSPRPNPFAE